MTTALLRSEIHRFLSDTAPEVICVRGRWGVGKTYAWLKYLGEVQSEQKLKLSQYSYVSLFGVNSLNDLRYSVFESTVTADQYLEGPNIKTLEKLLFKGMDWGRKTRPFLDAIGGALGSKDAGSAIARASFLLVRNQLVCFDDLERAGDGLKQRDILGLASFLKEQRQCKVVLLLNAEQINKEEVADFDRQLEKVVDISLLFDPTPAEAAAIALGDTGSLSKMLRPLVEKLQIVNIRTIKKIERMANLLHGRLERFGTAVVEQAISTLVLGAWSVLERGRGPSIDFLRKYNTISFGVRAISGKLTEEEDGWHKLLQDYGYGTTDDLDTVILDGVSRGTFDEASLFEPARQLQLVLAEQTRENRFSKAWDKFHGDLSLSDDEILDELQEGALENLKYISPLNLNGAVQLLRQVDRVRQADEIIERYVEYHTTDWKRCNLYHNELLDIDDADPVLVKSFADILSTFVDDRDPRDVLATMVNQRGWSPPDIKLLTEVDADAFVSIFEDLRGSQVRQTIEFLRMLGKQPEAVDVGATVEEALRRIARKSPLRAIRMRRYGIEAEVKGALMEESTVASPEE